MEDKPWIIDWGFAKKARCFNCRKEVTQAVNISPGEIIVTCENCKAERHYTIHGTFISERMPDFAAEQTRRKYDIWHFEKSAKCASCLKVADQAITLDEFKGGVVCPSCLFTRIYRFSLYTRPPAP